jgi:hypothetical protein
VIKVERSHFSKDQKAIAPLLLLENRAFGFVVVGCDQRLVRIGDYNRGAIAHQLYAQLGICVKL